VRLIERIQRLEFRATAASGGGDSDEMLVAVAAMSDEELDSVIRNLLVAMPPPDNAELAAVWERVIADGAAALTEDEYDRLLAWAEAF